MSFWVILLLGVAYAITLVITHYNGYQAGFKSGYEQGTDNINDYVLKINHAQGETIRKLRDDEKSTKQVSE